ncbi:MAG: M20/M25/M40 family metallo-hydrolase [Pyrinomonadaceae bacterium]
MRKHNLSALVLIFALVVLQPAASLHAQRRRGAAASAPASAASTPARRAAELIMAEELRAYLTFVASDEMEGRDTPSRGLDLTAKFLAMNLALWGAKPAGDNGTFFQRIALRREKLNAEQSRLELNGRVFDPSDYLFAEARAGTASGNLVYGGHGWLVKSKNIDALKDIDVRDKVVILLGGGLPPGVTFADLSAGKPGVDWSYPVANAQQKGARGVVYVPGFQVMSNWEKSRQNVLKNTKLTVERFADSGFALTGAETKIPSAIISTSVLNALFEKEKASGAEIMRRTLANEPGDSFALDANKKITLTVGTTVETMTTQNVVAVIEGSDPALKNEYVALGAHYDHVGRGTTDPSQGRGPHPDGKAEDDIWNGADDDGSGTVALLALAKALATGPARPKRSILFVWHAGEEKGLWGARYFTENPTVPLNQIVTQLNIDMIGRSKKEGDTKPQNTNLSGPNEVYVIGSKMMSTSLGELSERVNKSYLNLNFNYKYDDPKDPEKFFFRSDHYHYAQKGIPIIFYFSGVHEDYHRPSDSPDKIDYAKMEKVARTVFMMAWETADLAARPRVDKPLPTELTEK